MTVSDETKPTIREACRRRMPLGGPDAQALEGALQQVERELDAARTEAATLRAALEAIRLRVSELRRKDGSPAARDIEQLALAATKKGQAGRCCFVQPEPTPPPATCKTCGGSRKETFVFSHGQTIDEPCPDCAPPVSGLRRVKRERCWRTGCQRYRMDGSAYCATCHAGGQPRLRRTTTRAR